MQELPKAPNNAVVAAKAQGLHAVPYLARMCKLDRLAAKVSTCVTMVQLYARLHAGSAVISSAASARFATMQNALMQNSVEWQNGKN